MSKRTEFWLWWFTDDCGRRRRTSFRMSREEALKRYPDAKPIAGTLEIRSLSGTRPTGGSPVRRPETTNREIEERVAGSTRQRTDEYWTERRRWEVNMVLYHRCMSLDRAREIAREGFLHREMVRVTEHLSKEHARPPDDSHAVVMLGVPWDFRLADYALDSATGEHIVPAHVLNLFERAVWSV